VKSIAQKLDATEAQVLIAWGVKRGYSVIPKSVQEGKQPKLDASYLSTDKGNPN
jgi:diketogulonate reductase-like aldo/keto reductase